MEFTLLRDIRQTKSKIRMLKFRNATVQLFRELVNKISQETVPKDEREEELADL